MSLPSYQAAPRIVIWEMTRACQLACLHCRAQAESRRDPRELTTREGFRLIDQVAELGKPLLVLTGGDPMERGDLEEVAAYAVSKGLTTAVSPSATPNVTRERLQRLKDVGVHRIAVSLDGADRKTHDYFRGVSGSFDRTLAIAEQARLLRLPLQIGTTLTRYNAEQLEMMAALVGRLGAILWNVFFLVPTGRAQDSDMVSADASEAVLHCLYDISKRVRFAIKTTEAPHYRRIMTESSPNRPAVYSTINDGKGFVFISHTGAVCPSGFLPLEAGNVRYQSLQAIYRQSTLFQALRDPERLKGRCGACEYRSGCGGSRARAYAVYGDPLAEDPLCSYQPRVAV